MELKNYLAQLEPTVRSEFAKSVDTSVGQLQNIAYGYRSCSPLMAARIEQATKGAVTRQDLRPDDWKAIWPELTKPRKAKERANA